MPAIRPVAFVLTVAGDESAAVFGPDTSVHEYDEMAEFVAVDADALRLTELVGSVIAWLLPALAVT